MNEFIGHEGLKLKTSSINQKGNTNDTPKQKKVSQWKATGDIGGKRGLKRENSAGEFDELKNMKLKIQHPNEGVLQEEEPNHQYYVVGAFS